MIDSLKSLLGITSANYGELVRNGAIIVDVRTKGEFAGGHIRGSINIPVDSLEENLYKLGDKQKVVITCCASGMRSASAAKILLSQGYKSVYNGGGWLSLQSKL